jgi:leucyl aminopeptidase
MGSGVNGMVSEVMAMETKVEPASNKSGGMAWELDLEDQIRDELHSVLWAMQCNEVCPGAILAAFERKDTCLRTDDG